MGVEPSGRVLQLTVYRMMDKLSQGVTDGISRTMEDLPGNTNRELEVKSVAQSLTGESSNSLFVGIPRRLFDALHQSFSELNLKLASRVERNVTPERHDLDHPLVYDDILQESPPVLESAQSLITLTLTKIFTMP